MTIAKKPAGKKVAKKAAKKPAAKKAAKPAAHNKIHVAPWKGIPPPKPPRK